MTRSPLIKYIANLRIPTQFASRQCASRLAGFLFLMVILSLITVRRGLPLIGHWLAQPSHIDKVDAIVVLGGNTERTLRGIALYKQGVAPEFWHTGNTVSPDAAQLAIQHGVPAEAIHTPVTRTTWQDGQAIAALVKKKQGVQRILVVTEWHHSRRALSVIQHQLADSGISIYYAGLSTVPYGPDNWWQSTQGREVVFNELAKIGFYWWRYGVVP